MTWSKRVKPSLLNPGRWY